MASFALKSASAATACLATPIQTRQRLRGHGNRAATPIFPNEPTADGAGPLRRSSHGSATAN